MPYPLPLTRTEAYLAYKAGVIQQSDLKPSLAIPRNGIDAWLAYWTGLANYYPIKNLGKNIIDYAGHLNAGSHDGVDVSLNDATGQITVSGQPTRGYAKIVNTYDITNLLEDGKEYTISQSAYDNKLYAQVNAIPTTGSPVYIYSTSSAKTFTVDKSTYPRYNLVIQTGAQSAWAASQTITRTFQLEKGSSASAFEPYTGEPLILQEEEAYIAYLSGVINEYPEKCLRRVGAYLRYLISARWGRPDHPLNREELYLSLIKTQFIPSGDPSSDIEIDGTAKAAFVDVKMYGDTLQKTYTGSNLYLAKPYSNATQQGIKTKIKEGYIFECSGTATTTYANIADWTNVSLPAGTYTFCIDHTLTHKITMRLSFDPDTQDVVINSGNTSETVTVSSPIVAMRPFIATGGSGNVINDTIKLNIVAGSTPATVFEPYVGGISSPNPDYPQPVQTVTGLQTVEVTGRNLFDKDNAVIYALNPVSSGSALSPLTNACSTFIPITEGDTYTVSSTNRSLLDAYASVYFISGTPDTATTWITRTSFGQNDKVTTTAPAGATYLGIYFLYSNNQTTIANAEATIQVERGSTATEYTPFIKNIYSINLGKNLYVPAFTNPNVTLTEDGFEMTTSQNNTSPSWSAFATLELKLNPWTEYTLSKKSYVVEGNEYNHSGGLRTYIEGVYSGEKDEDSITFTTGVSGVVDLLFYTGYLDTTQGEIYTKVRFENVQIEAGPNATSYAPHFEPIELCKLGGYQDYIYKDGEDWKVHKATGKFVFTADTTPQNGRSKNGNIGFVLNAENNPIPNMHNPLVGACSCFAVESTNVTWTGINRTGVNASGALWFQTGDSDNPDIRYISQFFEWLAGSNATYNYALATATDITITNQTLIDQLEALVVGGAENGTTYIKVNAADPNLPGLLVVEAPKYE